jgi:hypothetical protein
MTHAFIMFRKEHSTRSSCANSAGRFCLAFLFFLARCSLPVVSGQQAEPILFNGIVLDADTREPLTAAYYAIKGKAAGAVDLKGMVSFYARPHDTVRFACLGYKNLLMVVSDTLRTSEYVAGIYLSKDTLVIPAVVIIPRLNNMRAEIMAAKPDADQELINATNNLKISTYQGLTAAARLDDPAANYDVIRHAQAVAAGEKGGIPSSQMLVFNPLILLPVIYVLATGFPEYPQPPAPYISARELTFIRELNDSLIYKSPRH